LAQEADQRVQGTVKEIVAERFARELPSLHGLPQVRYDTAYREHRRVSWDGYVEVRGNRYSVPIHLAGQMVAVRIGLDDVLEVSAGEERVARHVLQAAAQGWVCVPEHHAPLWQSTLKVQQRSLAAYEEVL